MEARAFEAWWLPAHVTWRYVAIDRNGHKTWHESLVTAEAYLFWRGELGELG